MLIKVWLRSAALLAEIPLIASGTSLVLPKALPILLVEIRLRPCALLTKISLILISKLLLIAVLVEIGRRLIVEVIRPVITVVVGVIDIVAIQVVVIDIVPVDIVVVDIVPVDVGVIDIVPVVVVVAICKRVRIGDVGVVVINHCVVMPPASPGVIAPTATAAAHRCPNRNSHAKTEQTGRNHGTG